MASAKHLLKAEQEIKDELARHMPGFFTPEVLAHTRVCPCEMRRGYVNPSRWCGYVYIYKRDEENNVTEAAAMAEIKAQERDPTEDDHYGVFSTGRGIEGDLLDDYPNVDETSEREVIELRVCCVDIKKTNGVNCESK